MLMRCSNSPNKIEDFTTQIDNQNLEQNQNQTNQHYQHQVSNTTASYELLDLKSTDTTKSQHYQTSSNSSCSSSSGSMMSMNSGLKLKNAQDSNNTMLNCLTDIDTSGDLSMSQLTSHQHLDDDDYVDHDLDGSDSSDLDDSDSFSESGSDSDGKNFDKTDVILRFKFLLFLIEIKFWLFI
jgi:hypothetical protein